MEKTLNTIKIKALEKKLEERVEVAALAETYMISDEQELQELLKKDPKTTPGFSVLKERMEASIKSNKELLESTNKYIAIVFEKIKSLKT
jgi:transcriptional regulator GlxA family with amidase domain